jgi:hypothetical protein
MISYLKVPAWLTPYKITPSTIAYHNQFKLCSLRVDFTDGGDVDRVRICWDLPEEVKDVTYSGEGAFNRAISDLACWDDQFTQQLQDLERHLEQEDRLNRMDSLKYIGLPLILTLLAFLVLVVYTRA